MSNTVSEIRNATQCHACIGYDDLSGALTAAYQRMKQLQCPVFDSKIPTFEWFQSYFNSKSRLMLIPSNTMLPGGTLGAVIKEIVSVDDKNIDCFVILISKKFKTEAERCFTIAHELAHVLLHGAILTNGMAVSRRYESWHQSSNKLRILMEVEANIVALHSIIPSSVIELAKLVLDSDADLENCIHGTLRLFYDGPIDRRMIRERLYLHDILNSQHDQVDLIKFAEHFWTGPSWVMNGVIDAPSQTDNDDLHQNQQVLDVLNKLSSSGLITSGELADANVRLRKRAMLNGTPIPKRTL